MYLSWAKKNEEICGFFGAGNIGFAVIEKIAKESEVTMLEALAPTIFEKVFK